MTRVEIANKLTSGLAGWMQLLASQNLHAKAGEDAARLVTLQILNAQNAYTPETSRKPINWGATKKRIDIALFGKSTSAAGWYGAFELKWAAEECDPHQVRESIVQDVTRLAFTDTTNMCANILLLGGTSEGINKLFDVQHPNAQDREKRRSCFCKILSRNLQSPEGKLGPGDLSLHFSEFGERIPTEVFDQWDGHLKTTLLSLSEVQMAGHTVGKIFAWQCKRTRGTVKVICPPSSTSPVATPEQLPVSAKV